VLSVRSTDGVQLLVRREWPVLDRCGLEAAAAAHAPDDAPRLLALRHPRAATNSLQAATLARQACDWARRATRGRVREVVRDERDRPRFRGRGPVRADLNLTHGAGVVAVAFDPCGAVGVDVEAPRAPSAALLADTVAPAELGWLDAAVDAAARARRFAHLWTLKESLAKCVGLGLALDPRELVFRVRGSHAELIRSRLRGAWTFTSFTLPGGVPCTVCRGSLDGRSP
jgi:4'-phosphopantetheinyl transferase